MDGRTRIWTDVHLCRLVGGDDGWGRVQRGAIAVRGGRILWSGPQAELPSLPGAERVDGGGLCLTPGLIDCHTHLVFGGDRADEFERRLAGESYAEIAASGGGIRASVRATRAASEAELRRSARERLRDLTAEGVTTVEIKSGYGLDTDTEVKQLQVARSLALDIPVSVRTTFLGLHALPSGQGRGEYLDDVIRETLPRVVAEGLADQADAFCEGIAFSVEECERFLRAASGHGLGLRLHADQLSDGGGAALAARLGADSADHLEYTSSEGVEALARTGTVAVLLPGAFQTLGEVQKPPVAALRGGAVPLAVATDLNPGTSPLRSLRTAAHLACTLFGLTPLEAFRGVTLNAARALGLTDRGTLDSGARADFALWTVDHPRDLVYWLGGSRCAGRVVEGEIVEG
ncbi:MAG: imidazolonepropionase [Gemmatimonadota bacterium]